jgi:hypothetical protein
MNIRQYTAAFLSVVIVLALSSMPLRVAHSKATLIAKIKQNTGARQVLLGQDLASHTRELKANNKGFSEAIQDLESQGYTPKYDTGVTLIFDNPEKAAAVSNAIVPNRGIIGGDPPPDPTPTPPPTSEITFMSFASQPQNWIGVVHDTTQGTDVSISSEMLITNRITTILSAKAFNGRGQMIERWFDPDYYDLTQYGFYGNLGGYYAALYTYGFCGFGCGIDDLFEGRPNHPKRPVPSGPVNCDRPDAPPPCCSPLNGCLPNPVPVPGPDPHNDSPPTAFQRCLLAGCIGVAWGCVYAGEWWPVCLIGGCGIVNPIMCKITTP